ncbi:unnamed protein product [Cylicocyclus nassatus]|uniref:Uncharacterized protein n=1 Tax=Cylicocyclus nassatus TaxID=53992 RepID=A0AA36GHJ3_CYLNA|nr:unnamed protein product [Cylicocyclus nassatus]
MYPNHARPYVPMPPPMSTTMDRTVKQILKCMEENYESTAVRLVRGDFVEYPYSSFSERRSRLADMQRNFPRNHNPVVDHSNALRDYNDAQKVLSVIKAIVEIYIPPYSQPGRNNNSWLGAGADKAVNLGDVYRQVENADSRKGKIICNFVTALLIQSYNPEKWNKLYVRVQPGPCYIVDYELIARFLVEVDLRNNNRLQNTYSGNVTECM